MRRGAVRTQFERTDELPADLFAYLGGRMFEHWVDFDSRDNGYDEDDLIENPAYILESILRDEIFTERDLELTRVSNNTFYVNDLRFALDDYYDGAIIYNTTRGEKDTVSDFVMSGSDKRINTTNSHASWDTGDKVYLTNIQGDNKIDVDSFDLVGNTADGLRDGWIFGKSVYQETLAEGILNEILFESRCILFTSFDKYKLVAIDDTPTEVATWTTPLMQNGKLLASASLSTIRQLYNDFRVNYYFDYGIGVCKKTLFVNKAGASSELTNGATYQATCKTLFDNYKIINRFEYNCNWIYDDDTAELFFDKIFEWYSKQRLIVNWATPVSDYLQYEVGDIIKLNNSEIIPTGVNNVSKFMIMETPLKPLPGAPFINFKLVEIS